MEVVVKSPRFDFKLLNKCTVVSSRRIDFKLVGNRRDEPDVAAVVSPINGPSGPFDTVQYILNFTFNTVH